MWRKKLEMSAKSKLYRLVKNHGKFDGKDSWPEIRRLKGLARERGFSTKSLAAIFNNVRSQKQAASKPSHLDESQTNAA